MKRRIRCLEFETRICLRDLPGRSWCRLAAAAAVTTEAELILAINIGDGAAADGYSANPCQRAGWVAATAACGMGIVAIDALNMSRTVDDIRLIRPVRAGSH